jgi:hypothetical protein
MKTGNIRLVLTYTAHTSGTWKTTIPSIQELEEVCIFDRCAHAGFMDGGHETSVKKLGYNARGNNEARVNKLPKGQVLYAFCSAETAHAGVASRRVG